MNWENYSILQLSHTTCSEWEDFSTTLKLLDISDEQSIIRKLNLNSSHDHKPNHHLLSSMSPKLKLNTLSCTKNCKYRRKLLSLHTRFYYQYGYDIYSKGRNLCEELQHSILNFTTF